MSKIASLERPAPQAMGHTYLTGNFAPVSVETTAFDLPVKGEIPRELEGRLLRIGPNPIDPDPATYHWFMGEGMAHGLRLKGGKAEWYRNRYIVSDRVAEKVGRPNIPGPYNGFGDGTANTNIIEIGGVTHAIVEFGALPVQLTDELESVARSDLGGTLKHGYTAHPKADAVTGELHAITYQPGLEALSYLVVDKEGRSRTVADIHAPHFPLIHDMAITDRFAIVLDLPVDFAPGLIGKGFPYAWNDHRTPRIGLIPRDGDMARAHWIEAPSCFVFHVMNAFDDGEAVVMDVVRHHRTFDRDRQGPFEANAALVRWRLDLASGRLAETMLFDAGCEFPRFNDAYAAQAYRFGYSASVTGGGKVFGPVHKHDVTTGRTWTNDLGPGRSTLEPVFVAREGATSEDDGYVMSYVYDAARNASDVVILDAQAFEDEPLAVISLPVRVPYGFHGNWIADRG